MSLVTDPTTVDDGAPIDGVIDPAPEDILDAAPTKAVARFDKLKAGLAALELELANYVPDFSTTAGDKKARAIRKNLVSLRTRAKEMFTELNKPLREAQAQAAATRDMIIETVEKLETPIDLAIKADEEIKAAAKKKRDEEEAARVAAIRQRITNIAGIPVAAVALTAEQIGQVIDDLAAAPINEERFAEFLDEAKTLAAEVSGKLQTMHAAAVAREETEARLAAEAQRQADEKDRLDAEAATRAEALAAQQADIQRQLDELARMRAELEAAKAPPPAPVAAPSVAPAPPMKRQDDAFKPELDDAIAAANAEAHAQAEERAALSAEEAAIIAAHGRGTPPAPAQEPEVPDNQLPLELPNQVHQASAVLHRTGGGRRPAAQADVVDAEVRETFVRQPEVEATAAPASAGPSDAPSDVASDYDYLVALARGIGATPLETLLRIKGMDLDAVFAAVMADDEVPA